MRNSPLKGFLKKSPIKNDDKIRTDSATTYDPITHKVDSTPVGHRLGTKAGGFGWGEAIKVGNNPSSMVKGLADDHATNKLIQDNIKSSRTSTAPKGSGVGGVEFIMPEQ